MAEAVNQKIHDVCIIGGGPAGYTAALYAARAGLDTLLIEKLGAGGQMATADTVENYPGFSEIPGWDLAERMKEAAGKSGAITLNEQVKEVVLEGKLKKIITGSAGEINARTVIAATGANPRELGIPNEAALRGKGLSYCATCDGRFFSGKTVTVVGGGNSALTEALFLSRICKKVYLVHRGDAFTGSELYVRQIKQTENIEVLLNSSVTDVRLDKTVTAAVVKTAGKNENRESLLECSAVFAAVGRIPDTGLFKDKVLLDRWGYIDADESTQTNIEGVFAAGDVRAKPLRQIVTAASDGAVAAQAAEKYLALNHAD